MSARNCRGLRRAIRACRRGTRPQLAALTPVRRRPRAGRAVACCRGSVLTPPGRRPSAPVRVVAEQRRSLVDRVVGRRN
jgi:hypothetical protein